MWRTEGASTRRIEGPGKEVTIPVSEEDISIGTREVERGHVRIYQPGHRAASGGIGTPAREEKVTVERRPVDRPATEADFAAAGKDVLS